MLYSPILRTGFIGESKLNSRARLLSSTPTRVRKIRKVEHRIVPLSQDDFVIDTCIKGAKKYRPHRQDGHLHVSDIVGKCPRMLALSKRFSSTINDTEIPDSLGLTFAQGNAIHDYIRNSIRDSHPDIIYGQWQCVCGALSLDPMTFSSARKAAPCGKCGKPAENYKELVLIDSVTNIGGSLDLLLLVNGCLYLVEIKSMAAARWNELLRPQPDHVIQALFYWRALRNAGYLVYDQMSILYATKDYVFKSPYKEFIVKPSEHMGRLDSYTDDALLIKNAEDKTQPLPVRTCMRTDAPDAKKCGLSALCFMTE